MWRARASLHAFTEERMMYQKLLTVLKVSRGKFAVACFWHQSSWVYNVYGLSCQHNFSTLPGLVCSSFYLSSFVSGSLLTVAFVLPLCHVHLSLNCFRRL